MATQNTGYLGYKVIEEYYSDDNTPTGRIMPNIAQISEQAKVDGNINTVTFNDTNDVVPTGGADGDIWYNQPSDALYKKVSGTWVLLTDRVTNDFYITPVINTDACPLPA